MSLSWQHPSKNKLLVISNFFPIKFMYPLMSSFVQPNIAYSIIYIVSFQFPTQTN